MITLYTYPHLFGLADNNPYGLTIVAFLRLCGLSHRQEHIVDTHDAPRGQLPYIVEDGTVIGDSDLIIAYLIGRHRLAIDNDLSEAERRIDHMMRRTLDDLYWVIVLFALVRCAVLAPVSRRTAQHPPGPLRDAARGGTGIQPEALPLPGDRPL